MNYNDNGYLLPNLNFDNRGLQNRYGTDTGTSTTGSELEDYAPLDVESGLQSSYPDLLEEYMTKVNNVNEYALKARELGVDVTNPQPGNKEAIQMAILWRQAYDDAKNTANQLKTGREIEKEAAQLDRAGQYGQLPTDENGRPLTARDLENFVNLKEESKLGETFNQVQEFGDQASVDSYNANKDNAVAYLESRIATLRANGNDVAADTTEAIRAGIIDGTLDEIEIKKYEKTLADAAATQGRHNENLSYKYWKAQQDQIQKDKEAAAKDKEEQAGYVKPLIAKVQNGDASALVGRKYGDEQIGRAEYDTSGNEAVIKLYTAEAKDGDEPFATIPINDESFGVIGNIVSDKSLEEILAEPEPSLSKELIGDVTISSKLIEKAFDKDENKSEAEKEINQSLKDGYTAEVNGNALKNRAIVIYKDGVEVSRKRYGKDGKDAIEHRKWLEEYIKPELLQREKATLSTEPNIEAIDENKDPLNLFE